MISIDDAFNEAWNKYGVTQSNEDNLLNTIYANTLAPFGIGLGNMVNDTVIGGLFGWVLGNIGRGVEAISPFSGLSSEDKEKRERYARLALLTRDWDILKDMDNLVPYKDSWITTAAKGALELHNYVSDELDKQEKQIIGENPNWWQELVKGSGSSFGYMMIGNLGAALAGTGFLPGLFVGGLIQGAGESLSEAGGFLADAYKNGQYDNGAIGVANKSFLTNSVVNGLLDTTVGRFNPKVNAIENPFKRWLAVTGSEVLNEILQEPSQQVIEKAAQNTLNGNSGFMSNLGESVKEWPQTFMELAPTVAGSTLLTQVLLGLGGLSTRAGRRDIVDRALRSQSEENRTRQYNTLKRQRENLQTRINNAYSSYGSNLDTDLDALQDIQNMEAQLQRLDNYIANFWGDTGIITNPVQDDDIDLFPDGEELITPSAQNEQSATPTGEKNTPPETDIRDNDDDEDDNPGGTGQVINSNETFDDDDLPPLTGLRTPTTEQSQEVSGQESQSANETELIPPVTGLRNGPQTSQVPKQSPNIARVRTMQGTEADVQYRVVDADDLIVSTLEDGIPNPAYPQEYQPRQRNREASRRQVDDMANNLDPELLGENPLASDGAPIVGNDLVVESGNGRVMAIKKAYKTGKAQNYRSWLKKNASKFGLNPDTISKLKNPVLVRERISEVDRVKFTSEANESSTAQMSASENAVNDAKKITNAMLADYDTNKNLAGNKSFIQSFLGLFSRNERGNLLQADGKISRSGLERILNALIAKAYNDTSIINRLSEVYDDDIKNISNALIQAAPKIAVLQNSGIRSEHSITEDIMQAANILVNLRQSGQSVSEYLGTLSMFDDVTPEAKKILKFFDDNKRSAKRISQGLINYAEGAMNEAKQGQAVLFEDSIRTKGQILDEAINHAQNESESYHQSANSDTQQEDGHFNIYQDGKAHQFTVRTGEYSDKHPTHKKYIGSFLEILDDLGRVVARYSPYTKKLQMAKIDDAAELKPQVQEQLNKNLRTYLRNGGFLDENGKLKSDGNEEFRHQYRTRADTTPKGKTVHSENLKTEERSKRKDTRTFLRKIKDSLSEKRAFKHVRRDIQAKIQEQLQKISEEQERDAIRQKISEAIGEEYTGPINLDAETLSRIKRNTEIFAKFYSQVAAARLNADAHLAGMSINELYKLWNFKAVADIQENPDARGTTEFRPPVFNKDGTLKEGPTIIMHLTNSANASTVLHEFAHIFLKDYQDLIATIPDLPAQVRQDWLTLTKWLGISDIDPKSTKATRTVEENERWQNAHEKFASAFEQYYMTGVAPTSWLKRAFNRFKEWMSYVYGSIKDIKYTGQDGQLHEIEISPNIKSVFDRMLKDNIPFVPSSENKEAMMSRVGLAGQSEDYFGQSLNSMGDLQGESENYNQPLNNDVGLDSQVNVVKIAATMPNIPFWQRIKAFNKSKQNEIIGKFKNGQVVNKHTGLTITLSKNGLNHILDTARANDNIAGEVIFQSVPSLDILAREAYRVETHQDRKPSATKIEGQLGNLKKVHRFLVPVEFNGDTHILKLTAKEFETGKAEIDEIILYDMKYAKKLSSHPSQNSPNLIGRATGTLGNPDMISVRNMIKDVNDTEGNPYFSEGNGETYNQIIGVNGARQLDETEGVTTRMDNLKVAQQMEKKLDPDWQLIPEGKSSMWKNTKSASHKIWLATGWFRGADAQWKYEIPYGDFIKEKINDINSGSIQNSKLSDIFDAPQLFKAYPNMKYIDVHFEDLQGSVRAMLNEDNSISIDIKKAKGSDEDLKNSLIHELQHFIQGIEGFASGGNYGIGRYLKDKKAVNKHDNSFLNPEHFSAKNSTRQANVIFENLSPKQQDNFTFLREAQKILSQDEFNKLLNDTLTAGFRKKFDAWSWFIEKAERHSKFAERGLFYVPGDEAYRYFAGEVEARNAAHRSTNLTQDERKNYAPNETQDVEDSQQLVFDERLTTFDKTLRKDAFLGQRQIEKFDQLVTHATGNIIWGNKFDLAYVGSGQGFSDFGHGAYFSQNTESAEKFRNSGKNKHVNLFRNEIIDRVNNNLANGVKLNEALDDIRKDTKQLIQDLQREVKALFNEFSHNDNSPIQRSKSTLKSKLIKAVKKLNALKSGLNLINSISTLEDFKKLQKKNGNLYLFSIPEDNELLDWNLPLFQQSREVQEKLKTMLNALAQMGFRGADVYKKAFFSQLGGIDITQGRAGNITGGMLYQNIMDFMRQEILKTLSPEQAREAFINHDKNIIPEAKIRTSQIFNEFGIPGHKFLDKSKSGSHNYVIWNTDKIKMTGIDSSSDSEAIDAFNNGGRNSEKETYNQQVLKADEKQLTLQARAQIEDVRKRYEGTKQWLKAPNGKKSNLSEHQWLLVRTPNFLNWFGDWINDSDNASKVVDENGEPLAVVHIARGKGGFSVFNTNGDFSVDGGKTKGTGAWFADLKGNENLSLQTAGIYSASEGKNIYHVFLNIRNPYVYDAEGKRWQRVGKVWIEDSVTGKKISHNYDGKAFSNLSWAQGFINEHLDPNGDEPNRFFVRHTDFQTSDNLVKGVRNGSIGDGNYDGVIIKNLRDMSVWGVDDYIIFDKENVKSSTRNNGNFSNTDASIYHQNINEQNNNQLQIINPDDLFLSPEGKKQLEDVRKKYQGTSEWMKAPNGKKTNLTEQQWLQVRTPNFKRWFGDWENAPETASKILDANGEPLVVYHGTNVPDINIFKRSEKGWLGPGMYFTPYKLYAKDYLRGKPGVIMDLFMNMRNPLFVNTTNPAVELLEKLYGKNAEAIFKERYEKMYSQMLSDFTKKLGEGKIEGKIEQNLDRVIKRYIVSGEELQKILEQGNYDGIAWHDDEELQELMSMPDYDNVKDYNTEYSVQNSKQVKSASRNNGNFSLNDGDIYHQTVNKRQLVSINSNGEQEIIDTPEEQLKAVRKKYKGTSQWLKAPNGKKTKLSERQWLQVRTENFKRKFGDWENDPENSMKVLDENGEPMPVYFGAHNDHYKILDPKKTFVGLGLFTSSRYDVADTYTREAGGREGGSKVYPLFLNIRNPYIIDAEGKSAMGLGDVWIVDKTTGQEFHTKKDGSAFIGPDDAFDYIYFELHDKDGEKYAVEDTDYQVTDDYVEAVINGAFDNENTRDVPFDGIIFKNIRDAATDDLDDDLGDVIVFFNKYQPKSASENSGEFGETADIYHQIIGEKGASNLDTHDSSTSRMDNLKIAQDMERAGKSPKVLWAATGWMRGVDGEWRHEIPDAKFKPKYRKAIKKISPKSPETFERLKSKAQGRDYDNELAADNEIQQAFHTAKNMQEFQKLVDGIMKKYNIPQDADNLPVNLDNLSPDERTQFLELDDTLHNSTLRNIFDAPELFAAYPDLANIPVLIEEMPDDKTYAFYDPRENTIVVSIHHLDELKELRKTIIHETQHAIQEIEGFARGSNEEMFKSKINSKGEVDINPFLRKSFKRQAKLIFDSLSPELQKQFRSLKRKESSLPPQEFSNLLESFLSDDDRRRYSQWRYAQKGLANLSNLNIQSLQSPRAAYLFTAGEVEARNAEDRSNWGEKRRRNTPLNESEFEGNGGKVPQEFRLVMDNRGKAYRHADTLRDNHPNNFMTDELLESYNQTAFHGTRHIIKGNNFDLAKIGTGEGNAMFGWGAYFAQNINVAQSYRRSGLDKFASIYEFKTKHGKFIQADFINNTWTDNGKKIPPNSIQADFWRSLSKALEHNPDALHEAVNRYIKAARSMIESLSERLEQEKSAYLKKSLQRQIDYSQQKLDYALENSPVSFEHHNAKYGNIYTFDIAEDYLLLDWEAKLSEQPEIVLNALKNSKVKIHDNETGEKLYRRLAKKLGSDKQASLFLNSLGIPGLRYLDKFTREGEEFSNTHNFVIWNSDFIKMLDVEGDADAVNYFNRTRENQSSNTESYNQQGLDDFSLDELVERYNQIGTKRKNEMDAALSKRRPDLTPEQRKNAIDYFNKYNQEHPDGFITPEAIEKFEQIRTHATGNIILGNKFDLRYVGSSEGSSFFGHGAYFEEAQEVAEAYRRYGLSLADRIGRTKIFLHDGTKILDSDFDNVEDEDLRDIFKRVNFLATSSGFHNWREVRSYLLNMFRENISFEQDEINRLGNGKKSKQKKDLLRKNIDRNKRKINFLKDIKGYEIFGKKNGNIYQFDIPEDYELLDWDLPLSQQPKQVKQRIKLLINEFVKRGYATEEELTSRPSRVFLGGIEDAKTPSGEITGGMLYQNVVNIAQRMMDNLPPQKDGITSAKVQASELFNAAGIPGHRFWDAGSRMAHRGTHNYVIWNMDKVKMVGIDTSSDKDAIDYFYRTKQQQENGFINSAMLETFNQNAYHGTGNIILGNKFDLRYKGSNEGGAMFGHGAYLAQSKKVPQTYRRYGLKRGGIGDIHITTKDGKSFDNTEDHTWSYTDDDIFRDVLTELEDEINRIRFYSKSKNFKRAKSVLSKSFRQDLKFLQKRLQTGIDANLQEDELQPVREAIQNLKDKIGFLRSIDEIIVEPDKKGNVYTFDVPEDYELLDWDAPLSEQPEQISEAIKEALQFVTKHENDTAKDLADKFAPFSRKPEKAKLLIEEAVEAVQEKFKAMRVIILPSYLKSLHACKKLSRLFDANIYEQLLTNIARISNGADNQLWVGKLDFLSSTGGDLYHSLQNILGSDEAASNFLNNLGIPGHRFWDAGSRNAKKGTHNFVIWNMDKLKMLAVEGDTEAEEYFKKIQQAQAQDKAQENSNSESYNQVIGEKSSRNTDEANSETFRTDNLKISQDMKSSKKDAKNTESYNQLFISADEENLSPERRKQIQEVRKKYEGTDKWLKAPNGKKSNLNEQQWLQVRTENFKRWFGDWENDPDNASKVVDENGEPLVVYRGEKRLFSWMKELPGIIKNSTSWAKEPGSFFTTSLKAAITYTAYHDDLYKSNFAFDDGLIYRVFLNIRNPYIFEGDRKNWDMLERHIVITDGKNHILHRGFKDYEEAHNFIKENYIGAELDEAVQKIREHEEEIYDTLDQEEIQRKIEELRKAAEDEEYDDDDDENHEFNEDNERVKIEEEEIQKRLSPEERELYDKYVEIIRKYKIDSYYSKTDDIVREVARGLRGVAPNGEQFDGIIFKNIYDTIDVIEHKVTQNKEELFGDVIVPLQHENIKSAIRNNGNFSPSEYEIYNQIIGSNGARNLDEADNDTLRIDSRKIAQDMFLAGKDDKTIRLATGWELGHDGKWRYEILDGDLIDNEGKDNIKLPEIFKAPQLYNAYPFLKNLTVAFDIEFTSHNPLVAGGWDKENNTIHLRDISRDTLKYLLHDTAYLNSKFGREELDSFKGILIHEIQHAIQDTEGFAIGTSESTIQALQRNAGTETPYSHYAPSDVYWRTAGEVEARNTKSRMNLSEKERRNSLLNETEDVHNLFTFRNYDELDEYEPHFDIEGYPEDEISYRAESLYQDELDSLDNDSDIQDYSKGDYEQEISHLEEFANDAVDAQDDDGFSEIYHQSVTLEHNPLIERFEQVHTFDNPDTERAFSDALSGNDDNSSSILQNLGKVFHGFKGDFPELAGNKDFIFARETLRKLGRRSDAKTQIAVQSLEKSLQNLSLEQFNTFTRVMLIKDLYTFQEFNPEDKLPLGFTRESLEAENKKFTRILKKDNAILQAVLAEYKVHEAIKLELSALAEELGMKKFAEKVKRYDFYILDYARVIKGGNLNANYISAMGDFRTKQLQDIERLKALKDIRDEYDIKKKLQKKHGQQWGLHIPTGYRTFNPLAGQFVHSAHTLTENILDMAIEQSGRDLGLDDKAVKEFKRKLSDNSGEQLLVLPNEIIESLDSLSEQNKTGPIMKILKAVSGGWKKVVLFFPTRAFKYNLRNLTGDADALIAGNPQALNFKD